jgi:hypothetical protein
MRGDTAVRGGAALILIACIALAASLYDPLSIPIEIEIALPVGILLGIGAIALWYRAELIGKYGRL